MNKYKITTVLSKVFFFGIVVIFSSCNGDDIDSDSENITISEENEISFEETIALFTTRKEPGSIFMEVNNFVGQSEDINNSYISEKPSIEGSSKRFSKSISLFNQQGEQIIINNSVSGKSLNTDVSYLYGQELTYYDNEVKMSKTEASSSKTVVVPQIITLSTNTTTVVPGTVVSWNVDNANNHGVVIIATYNPLNQTNSSTAQANPYRIVKGIALPDKVGSYTVTRADLAKFPDNSKIELSVARGTTTTATNKSPTVTAITKSTLLVNIDF